MTKQELVERVYERFRALDEHQRPTKRAVAELLDMAFDEIARYFVGPPAGDDDTPRLSYPGFGTFARRQRAARKGRDPRSGESISIPATTTVTFAPGQELRRELNRPSSAGHGHCTLRLARAPRETIARADTAVRNP